MSLLNLTRSGTRGSLPFLLKPTSYSPRFARCFKTLNSCIFCKHEEEQSGPIKFSTSKAFQMEDPDRYIPPKIQRYSVALSVAVFLLYFCVLREENDLDENLYKESTLYDRFDNLEKLQVKNSIKNKERQGLEASDLRKRLAEIEEEERKQRSST